MIETFFAIVRLYAGIALLVIAIFVSLVSKRASYAIWRFARKMSDDQLLSIDEARKRSGRF
jgi:hypothetical protein